MSLLFQTPTSIGDGGRGLLLRGFLQDESFAHITRTGVKGLGIFSDQKRSRFSPMHIYKLPVPISTSRHITHACILIKT